MNETSFHADYINIATYQENMNKLKQPFHAVAQAIAIWIRILFLNHDNHRT